MIDYDGEYDVSVCFIGVKANTHKEAEKEVKEQLGNLYAKVTNVKEINEKIGGNPNEK